MPLTPLTDNLTVDRRARYGSLTDGELVSAFQAGEIEAFSELHQRYEPHVARICYRGVGDRETAADLTQEAFTRLFERLAGFTHGEGVGNYVARVAKRLCIDHYRRGVARREHPLKDAEAELLVDTNVDVAGVTELSLTCAEVLGGVGEKSARLLRERHMEGRPLADIAADLDSTPGSIAVLLFRARRQARNVAQSRGLAGLSPIHLFHRLRSWLSIMPTDAIAAIVMAPVVAALWGLAPPSSSPPREDRAPVAVPESTQSPPPEAQLPSRHTASALDQLDAVSRSRRSRSRLRVPTYLPYRAHRQQGRPGSHQPRAPERSLVHFNPIALPGTDRKVEPKPSTTHPPEYDYGVRVGGRNTTPLVRIAAYQDDDMKPIHEQGCDAATTVPAGTYCERAPER